MYTDNYPLEVQAYEVTQITDILAKRFEEIFAGYRKAAPKPNLYLLGSPRALLEDDKKYFSVLRDSKGREHLQDYIIGTPVSGIRLEDEEGNVIINNAFEFRNRVRYFPTVPVWGREVLRQAVYAHILSILNYRMPVGLYTIVNNRFPEGPILTSAAGVIEDNLVPEAPPALIQQYIKQILHYLDRVETYVGNNLWGIFKVEFITERLSISLLGDYRIWDWYQIQEAKKLNIEEKLENGEISAP